MGSFVFQRSVSQNHYQILGVAPTAPAAAIKQAYRRLVVRYHPDKHGGDTRYEDQFKAVAVAYRVLGDPGRRATYDFQLAQAVRRLDEQHRQQQYRPASQHVYGVPMPAPAPLRTRSPAGSHERHYQRIPRQQARFTRRDWALTLLLVLGIVLFALALKVTSDRLTAASNYRNGLRAYGQGQWVAAYGFLEESLAFRPDYGPALRRRGELELRLNHDPRAARADFQAALRQPQTTRAAADLLYRLGRCEADLGRPAAAEQAYTRALALDTALSVAYLARGETRLLGLHRPPEALADLSRGLAQRQRQAAAPAWYYVQARGVALAALGRYAEARTDYYRVLRACPRDGRTHFLLGRLAQQTGNAAAACELYRRAVALGFSYARTAQKGCE